METFGHKTQGHICEKQNSHQQKHHIPTVKHGGVQSVLLLMSTGYLAFESQLEICGTLMTC